MTHRSMSRREALRQFHLLQGGHVSPGDIVRVTAPLVGVPQGPGEVVHVWDEGEFPVRVVWTLRNSQSRRFEVAWELAHDEVERA